MNQTSTGKTDLPLIRLSLVSPFIEELERRDINCQNVLSKFDLVKEDILQGDIFVPAPVMYGLVEKLSAASGDPYFGVRIGEELDPFSWPPLAESAELSTTVGEFLLRFLIDAAEDASSVTYVLETRGVRTIFHEKRKVDGNLFPRHNDGFTIAFLLTLLSQALGEHWQGNNVLASLCDPDVLPDSYLGVRTATTDTFGPSINFPCSWLVYPLAMKRTKVYSSAELKKSPIPAQWIEALRQILQRHIHEFDLTTKRVAEICGYSKRTLSRKLQAHGTSMQREVANMRKGRAEQELANSNRKISEIAAMLGYADSTVFSHAFKRWTGTSPSQYRRRFAVVEKSGTNHVRMTPEKL
jgi:AraC-like DNA-binding protein